MEPDVFMNDFERTEQADAYYAAIGRLLSFATRFEGLAKSISNLAGLRKNRRILDSDENIGLFTEKLNKMPLAEHFTELGLDTSSIGEILKVARNARNDVAHELTRGLDCLLDRLPEECLPQLLEHTRELAIKIAEGDRIVSYIASAQTGDELPTARFFKAYPDLVAEWVCEL